MLNGFLAVILSLFSLLFPSVEITETNDPFLNDPEFCYVQDLNLIRTLTMELEAHLAKGGKLPSGAELAIFFSSTVNTVDENGELVIFEIKGEEILKDSRGNRIVYEINDSYSFVIYGIGEDEIPNTDDDVCIGNPPLHYISEELLFSFKDIPYAQDTLLLTGEIFTLQKIRMFNTFAQYYHLRKGKFLKIKFAETYFAKYLMGDVSLKDAWDNNMIMIEQNGGIEFVSVGRDGIFGQNIKTGKCDDLYGGDIPPTLRALNIDSLLKKADGG